MINYVQAENIKCKRIFAKKLVIIAPLCMVLLAIKTGIYFTVNGYNWWYTMILPGFITLLTALINQNEEKKLAYRAVFALPVSLKKTWCAKTSLICIYIVIASLIHMCGILLGMFTIRTGMSLPVYKIITATLLLIVTSLWQVPLCLFLSKKFGLLTTVLLNIGIGIPLGILAAGKPFWWACPYSWSVRLMCPVLGILPNGLFVKAGDPLLNSGVIPIGAALSVILFILLLTVTAKWFSNLEVK